MDDKKLFNVPYVVYESAQTRNDAVIKRLILALIIVTSLLFVSNILWLYSWNQYDYAEDEIYVHTDSGGDANYIGNDGEINNGDNLYTETPADKIR